MAWVKPNQFRGAILGRFNQWFWAYFTADSFFILVGNVALLTKTTLPGDLALGKDIHLAISMDTTLPSSIVRFHSNGKFRGASSATVSETPEGVGDWIIGAHDFPPFELDGEISENRLYRGVLSDAKIETIFNNESSFSNFFTQDMTETIP